MLNCFWITKLYQMQDVVLSGLHSFGSKAICSTSIPKSLFPLLTRKSPSMPHFSPQEFLTIQYLVSVFLSSPHPTMTTEWFMSIQEMPLSFKVFSDGPLFSAAYRLSFSRSSSVSTRFSSESSPAMVLANICIRVAWCLFLRPIKPFSLKIPSL